MQMLNLQPQTLTVLVAQIYAKGMFAGMSYESFWCPKCCRNIVHQCKNPTVVVQRGFIPRVASLDLKLLKRPRDSFLPVLIHSTYYRIVRNDRGSDEAPDPLEASLYLTCDYAGNIGHLWRENA